MSGQVGDNSGADCVTTPSHITATGVTSWSAVAVNGSHTCAIADAGAVYCWGQNEAGELGSLGDTTAEPTQTLGGQPMQEIALGLSHARGIATDGKVYCWGLNVYGEAGPGERFHDTPTPVQF